MLKKIILKIIKFYQNFISPFLNKNCRFYPSCSTYTFLAIEKYGTIKGLFRSLKRLLRCNPWCQGGVDFP